MKIYSGLILIIILAFFVLSPIVIFGSAEHAVYPEDKQAADIHGHDEQSHKFAEKLEAFRNNKAHGLLFGVLSLVFLYGILHGLSLAHGGSVISAWVLSSRQKFSNVVTASVLTGFFHALSATVVVFTTWFILQGLMPHEKLQGFIKNIAAVFIIATGISMIYNFITAKIKGTCTHCHGHGHEENGMNPIAMAFMAGMMPCPVTSVILVTSLGLNMPYHGLIFMGVFAFGMALAIFGIAAAIWFLKEKAEGLKMKKISETIENVLPVAGALLFIFIGIFLLVNGEI